MGWKDNPSYTQKTAAIAINTQQSAEVDLGRETLVGVLLPAAFTGTALTFQTAAESGGTFVDVQDGAGSAYTVTVAQGKYVPVDYTKFLGVRFLKVKSGSSEAAARTVALASRPIWC